MTTQVNIKSPRGNHENVEIIQRNPTTGEEHPVRTVLSDGDKHSAYVHSGTELVIREVSKATSESTVTAKELTFGEKAVGLSFNPSGDASVANCKDEFAVVIDRMNGLRAASTDPEVKRMASVAITEAQSAQMWAVKALTWKS